jgi:hypothetical protein
MVMVDEDRQLVLERGASPVFSPSRVG